MVDEDNDDHLVALGDACQLLYLGAWPTKLVATMLLMNVCIVHGVNNKFVDELLSLLHKYLLLLDNCLHANMYHAKTLMHKVRFNYKVIHACPNGCVLFQGVYAKLMACLKCGSTRYKDVGRSSKPVKVLWFFLIIPRLKRMFRALVMSNLMVWHVEKRVMMTLFVMLPILKLGHKLMQCGQIFQMSLTIWD
jgi:hypothetical protein